MKTNACQFFIICGMANRISTKIETTVTNILRDHQTFIGKHSVQTTGDAANLLI